MRPAPPEDRQKIIDLYKDGMTRPAIARETGWSEGTVHNVIKAAGVQGAGRVTGIRTDPETEARVMEMYHRGTTWRKMVEATGRTEHTVSAIIKRNSGSLDRHGDVTPEMRSRIPGMYTEGLDAPKIGRILGDAPRQASTACSGKQASTGANASPAAIPDTSTRSTHPRRRTGSASSVPMAA